LVEARKAYEQVLQVAPTNADALEFAAYCQRKLNNTDAAITLYQNCLKVKPSQEGPLFYLGEILYKQHRHAECQHYLTRLVSTNCDLDYKTGALYILAKSHVSLDEFAEAETQARAGLELKPNHPHFLFVLALVKNRLGEYDASISNLEVALRHCETPATPGHNSGIEAVRVDCYDWLAQAYERKKDYPLAMSHLDTALRLDPSHASSLITKGLVYIQLKQFEQAETTLKRALAVEKNHALALVRLGYCKLLLSDAVEATQLFNRALQQRCGTVVLPRSLKGTARVYLALTLMTQDDVTGALFQIAEARKCHKSFSLICKDAKAVIVQGVCEGLVEKLRTMHDLDVNTAQAWQVVHLLAKELETDLNEKEKPPERRQWTQEKPPERRQWTEERPPERRQWTSPEPSSAGGSSAYPATQPSNAEQPQWDAIGPRASLLPFEKVDFSTLTMNECLGTGGFGAVYRGMHDGREVAIKRIFCEDGGAVSRMQLEELEKEVAALRSLQHVRLVRFIGACLIPPDLALITEFMPNGSLHHLLHKSKVPLTGSDQTRMAMHVSEGLEYLHGRTPPVVHRDVKSLNVVLDFEYNAKLCDFGLTQSMDKTHISLKDGGNGGSPRYMAPECYDSKGRITEKVDVWALGCILIEVFGGPLPYDDCTNIQQIVAKVLIEKVSPHIPSGLPKGLRAIVEECFQFDPKLRTTTQDICSRMARLRPTLEKGR
jgi:tetratricopeptide (TPR) repeat protein